MKSAWQDLRFAARGLRRAPGFFVVAVLTISLGIGATTAVYSLLRGILLEPLPFPEPGQLVWLGHEAVGRRQDQLLMTPALYTHYRSASRTLDQIAIYRYGGTQVSSGDEGPQVVNFTETTPELAAILGARPSLGRWISAGDVIFERAVVVLAHDLWVSRYGGDPTVLGKVIDLSGGPHEVIGVMEEGFSFPGRNAVWVPYVVRGTEPFRATDPFGAFRFFGVGRLAPDVSAEEARIELTLLLPRVRDAVPGDFASFVLDEARLVPTVEALATWGVAELQRTLWLLFGAVVIVLLIACVNVANLLLVRAEARRRVMAVRIALGAGHLRVLRLHLAEGALLAGAGGALGCVGAVFLLRMVQRFVPESTLTWGLMGRGPESGLNGGVLLFALGVCLTTAVVFAAIPALRPMDVSRELKQGSVGTGLARPRARMAGVLVASEVALTMALLAGGGLMLRSLVNLNNTDLGFAVDGRLKFRLSTRLNRVDAATFHQSVLERLASLPGVEAVGAVRCLPLSETCHVRNTLFTEEGSDGESRLATGVVVNVATEGYFEALGVPLLAGRTIERSDHELRSGAVVISASTAERLWPAGNPIGKRLGMGVSGGEPSWLTVVGVVGDMQPHSLAHDAASAPTIYTAMVVEGSTSRHPRSMSYIVRTAGEPLALVPAVQEEVHAFSGNVRVASIDTMKGWVAASMSSTRLSAALLGLGALAALFLSCVGVYGVVSYTVSQRTREIAIRMALGARGYEVRRLMLRRCGVPGLIGVGVGLVLAISLTGSMESSLVGIGHTDPVTMTVTALLLLCVVFVATYVPAHHAAVVDPAESLRVE